MTFEEFLKDCAKRQNDAGKSLDIRLCPIISHEGKVRFYAHAVGVNSETVDYDVVGDEITPINNKRPS